MSLSVETIARISLLVPMDDPQDETCRWGAPAIIWGPPGIGKSDEVREASAYVGLGVAELFLSTIPPEDLSGIQYVNKHDELVTHFPHPGIRELIKCKRGVIFVDELTCARPAVQGAGLSLVRDRILANQRLPGGIRIIAAANPPDQAAGGWSLALPMTNRLMHFETPSPDPERWASWRMGNQRAPGESAVDGEERIRRRWPDVFPKYQGLFAGFIKSLGSDKLLSIPKEGHASRGRAWPSPRTWDMATRVAATCEALDDAALRLDFIAACVGDGPAAEWGTWVKNADMPDPQDMLKNGWKPDKRRLDICFAAYGQAIAWTLARPDARERAQWAVRAWGLLTDAWKTHALLDVACAAAIPLTRAGFKTTHSPEMDAAARELLKKIGDKMHLFIAKP